MTYSELLKDPRWQRKKNGIVDRDDYTCQHCGAKDKTLNVHHGYYKYGLKPWEYEDKTLHTLCEDCHKEADNYKREVYYLLATLSLDDLIKVTESIRVLTKTKNIRGIISNAASNGGAAKNISEISKDNFIHIQWKAYSQKLKSEKRLSLHSLMEQTMVNLFGFILSLFQTSLQYCRK